MRGFFDVDKLTNQLTQLEEQTEQPDFWENPDFAKSIMLKKSSVSFELNRFIQTKQEFCDALEWLQLLENERSNKNNFQELDLAENQIKTIIEKIQKYRLECLLCGEADSSGCYLEIHAGAGGTEAQDWAQMLLRMYLRWAESKNYLTEILEQSDGEEAGIKSITIKIDGVKAYGWLKRESGVHRLVRISPFDSNARRHTSFASVWVYPIVDDQINIVIEEKDLRIDTYRASGAGGQHVNKTESAIRITHIPTKIVVQCQNDRSQHRNKATAMQMLKARLYELELQHREQNIASANESKTEIGWGHQIRSYVLQPYQMIKDLRTGFEKGNTEAVLNGQIDEFLYSSLTLGNKNIKE